MSDSLWPHEPQHTRPSYPSPTPGVHPSPCPLSVMPSSHLILCHLLILSPSIFPSIRVFSNESEGQHTGVSASTSVLPMNIQDWFPLGWTGWICLQSKGLSRVFSSTTVQNSPWNSPGQNTGAALSLPGDLPNPGIEPRFPTLQMDSSPAEPQGKPKNTGAGSLSLLQGIFPT